jgi:hypothetical protein
LAQPDTTATQIPMVSCRLCGGPRPAPTDFGPNDGICSACFASKGAAPADPEPQKPHSADWESNLRNTTGRQSKYPVQWAGIRWAVVEALEEIDRLRQGAFCQKQLLEEIDHLREEYRTNIKDMEKEYSALSLWNDAIVEKNKDLQRSLDRLLKENKILSEARREQEDKLITLQEKLSTTIESIKVQWKVRGEQEITINSLLRSEKSLIESNNSLRAARNELETTNRDLTDQIELLQAKKEDHPAFWVVWSPDFRVAHWQEKHTSLESAVREAHEEATDNPDCSFYVLFVLSSVVAKSDQLVEPEEEDFWDEQKRWARICRVFNGSESGIAPTRQTVGSLLDASNEVDEKALLHLLDHPDRFLVIVDAAGCFFDLDEDCPSIDTVLDVADYTLRVVEADPQTKSSEHFQRDLLCAIFDSSMRAAYTAKFIPLSPSMMPAALSLLIGGAIVKQLNPYGHWLASRYIFFKPAGRLRFPDQSANDRNRP